MDRASVPPGDAIFVSGYFDPLLAADAVRLRELRAGGRRLVAVIRDPQRPLLPARARAELVAALECVDAVVIGGGADVSLDQEQARAFDALVAHVARRHGR